jgi:DNA-binding NarL/FixJ family response regulator
MTTNKKSIVLAEDQTLVRQGLKALLEGEADMVVVSEAKDGLDTIRQVNRHRPDLLLLDLAMPRMNGIAALKEVRKQHPELKIVILTFHTEDEYILATFQAGANGYCLKSDSHTQLMTALRRVLEGQKYISPAISDKVLEGYLENRKAIKTDTTWESVTPREKEVLQLVGEGYTSPEIADLLCISPKTVDKHRANLMKKLDRHNVSALTAYAIEKGLVNQRSDPQRP